jgi:hypothetical protein
VNIEILWILSSQVGTDVSEERAGAASVFMFETLS